jgi:uncharacterized membrane protein YgdD (TMEM256/DUF423 family)
MVVNCGINDWSIIFFSGLFFLSHLLFEGSKNVRKVTGISLSNIHSSSFSLPLDGMIFLAGYSTFHTLPIRTCGGG